MRCRGRAGPGRLRTQLLQWFHIRRVGTEDLSLWLLTPRVFTLAPDRAGRWLLFPFILKISAHFRPTRSSEANYQRDQLFAVDWFRLPTLSRAPSGPPEARVNTIVRGLDN